MAEFSVIKESEAPRRRSAYAGKLANRMAAYELHVGSVKRGQVGKVVPGENESVRGEALRVSRAAKRMGKSAKTWVVDGTVYFSVS